MSRHSIQITDDKLYNDIVEYCKLNKEKINDFCQRILKEQLLIEKYGDTPFGNVTNVVELPPVVPIDAKDIIKPHINNMVEEYTKTINDKIIEHVLGEVTETITNSNSLEKYKDKNVPKEFYGEIKVEELKKKKIRRL